VVIGYWPMLIHTALVSWQLEQLPVTPLWIIAAVGAGLRKALPGALLVATAGTNALGVLPRWQFSHLVELGRCEPAPLAPRGGMTTILVTPKKVAPVMPGPWQTSQLLVMPLWLNWALPKVVMPALAPLKGTKTLGMLLVWQLSQPRLPMGMCAGVRLEVLGVTP